jgi:putative transposase
VCKVRDEGVVRNKAAHLAVGVDVEGRKHVLGIWVETTEGAKFWLRVITELRNRGIEDVLFVCCDGLKGLAEAIETIWPKPASRPVSWISCAPRCATAPTISRPLTTVSTRGP